jgi:hypothetical protein
MAAVRSASPVAKSGALSVSKSFYFGVAWPLDAETQRAFVHVQVFDYDDAGTAFRVGELLFPLASFTRGAVVRSLRSVPWPF